MVFPRLSVGDAVVAGLVLGASCLVSALPAQAREQIGVLECNVSPGVGLVITSSRALACRFMPTHGGPEYYVGTIKKLGLDVGVSGAGRLVWGVFAPSANGAHPLAGHYLGVTAEASVGAGLGANVLVGGSDRTIALQPVSVSSQSGLNIAAGVGELTLEAAPPPHR